MMHLLVPGSAQVKLSCQLMRYVGGEMLAFYEAI